MEGEDDIMQKVQEGNDEQEETEEQFTGSKLLV